jgi:ribosomal protein L7Ae-like RNA K-turn-binding protein
VKSADRYLFTPIYREIQEEKSIFFVVDIIDNCEKKESPYEYVPNSEWLPKWSCLSEKKAR